LQSHSLRSDRSHSLRPGQRLEERFADEARFFKSWLDRPLLTGAVSPSGRFLARMMARYVDPLSEGPIVELGPGTGPITEALLKRGIAPERLFLVEFDPAFCELLRHRFPGVQVIEGDAYHLQESLKTLLQVPAAAIVSSLPLLTKPETQRLALLKDAFACLTPEGPFIQFTYGLASPIPCNVRGYNFRAQVSPPVWFNLPPARVWVYGRPLSQKAVSQKAVEEKPKAVDFFAKLKTETGKIEINLCREFKRAKARLNLDRGRVQTQKRTCGFKFLHKLPDLKNLRFPK
jgi:phosphatidylethanolamine/phosphatidyl-N-methylethanolamine N-methyltransferase